MDDKLFLELEANLREAARIAGILAKEAHEEHTKRDLQCSCGQYLKSTN